jgi:tRNA (cmo5U34)-methyltransferase
VTWTESDSELFQELAAVGVPDRAEQMATLLALLPFGAGESGRVVELGCGEGRLTQLILEAFPRATALALDGSAEMRAQAAARLDSFGSRATVAQFELASPDWWPVIEGADAVVSSLAIHHLDGPGKQRLFGAMAARLRAHGALLIADLVQPTRAEAEEVFASGWDAAAERQSRVPPGSARALEQFIETQWNIFHYPDPKIDKPSPLFDQLVWLREAGFPAVDCFWLRAGHAVYGGYRTLQRPAVPPLSFATALALATVLS